MPAIHEFGPFLVDVGARRLSRDGEPVALAPKAFDLLCHLLAHPQRLLGKAELLQAVWPRGFVEEGNLSHNIFLLRKALGESPEQHRYIVTVPGRGYQCVGEVRSTGAASPQPAAATGVVLPGALAASFGGAAGLPGQAFSIATGDFNGDGKLDLAVMNQTDGTISILLNTTEPGASQLSFAHAVSFGKAGPEGADAKSGAGAAKPSTAAPVKPPAED